jgi:hypothetical protein
LSADPSCVMAALPPKSGHCQETPLVTLLRPGGVFLTTPSSFFSSHARSSAVRAFAASVNGMQTKTDQIRAAWFRGDRIAALRIAAQFFDRSNETMIFKRGMDANNHPGFYRQLGKEPQELVAAALALLQKRFDLR